MFVRRGVCQVDCYTRKIKRTNDCIYTQSGKRFANWSWRISRKRVLNESLRRLAGWSGGRWAMMKLHKRSGSMDLVKWLALCAIREKKGEREEEREGEQKKKRNAIAIIIPFDQETERHRRNRTILLFQRGGSSPTSIVDRRFRRCLRIVWKEDERRGRGKVWEKKADENWSGIDRDRWHLTWHLTNRLTAKFRSFERGSLRIKDQSTFPCHGIH